MEIGYELTIHDYIDIVRQRILLIFTIFSIIFLSSIGLALILPPVYQSSGTILVESQQISSDIITSTVTGYASEQIDTIKQRVMTRENLIKIISKYGLYDSNNNNNKISSTLVNKLKTKVNLELLSSNLKNPRRNVNANIAFSIAFEDKNPEFAFKVTKELVRLFLDENIKSRVERASETTGFLIQEAKRLKSDLEKMESLVAAYKQEHSNALPEHLALKIGILERAQKNLSELDSDYKSTEIELNRLKLELATEKIGDGGDGSPITELERLKAEYNKALVLYKENHPSVRTLRHKISALNKSVEDGKDVNSSMNIVNSAVISKIEALINTTKSQLRSIDDQRKPLKKKINELEQQIIKTPQVELGLSSLLRDHGNAKKKYEEIQAKRLTAQIAENLEGENKSERFTLIDPPVYADKPVKPNRIQLIVLGLLAGLVSGIGLAVLMEVFGQKVRGANVLGSITGYEPLVSIPYIVTEEEVINREKIIKYSSYALIGLTVIIVLVVNIFIRD